jgi:hypothetical protein
MEPQRGNVALPRIAPLQTSASSALRWPNKFALGRDQKIYTDPNPLKLSQTKAKTMPLAESMRNGTCTRSERQLPVLLIQPNTVHITATVWLDRGDLKCPDGILSFPCTN